MTGRAPTVALATVVLLVLAPPAAPAWYGPGQGAAAPAWQELLRRAAEAARAVPYAAETLWVTDGAGGAHVAWVEVEHDGDGGVVVGAVERPTAGLGEGRGGRAPVDQGWLLAVPEPPVAPGAGDVPALGAKYDVLVAGHDRLLDRPCTKLEIRRRLDGSLAERLWLDDGTGLVLRRESYARDGDLARLGAHLGLDLSPRRAAPVRRAGRDRRGDGPPPPAPGVAALTDREVAALREAGWPLEDSLPGGYARTAVYALSTPDSQPLQAVYRDGLYSLSVFQQAGPPDWSSLPPGATRVEELSWQAYEWPGALPQRLVWEAGGRTWSIVGDAPREELLAAAGALADAESAGLGQRLRESVRRLWSWLSAWG